MKKLLLACSLFFYGATVITAQDKEGARPQLSKEKKAELKKMKEEHLEASFKEAGLKEEQITQARAILEESRKKGMELKEDTSLTEEQRMAKKEVINQEKNEKLRSVLGEKYKEWQAIRKKQKAAEEEFVAANSGE